MITEIEIRGFKCFHRQAFKLGQLSILAGLNGSGKTSVIHALLLAWEASAGASGSTVRLNGPFGIELGTAEDVRNWRSDDFLEFHLSPISGNPATWRFGVPSDDALYLTVEEKPEAPPAAYSAKPRSFSYLCAERLGPPSVLGTSPFPAEELEVGVRGEQCAQILATIGSKLMADISPKRGNVDLILIEETLRPMGDASNGREAKLMDRGLFAVNRLEKVHNGVVTTEVHVLSDRPTNAIKHMT